MSGRTLRITQDDARVADQIQGVVGGQPRDSIVTHGISISLLLLLLGWTASNSLTIRLTELLRIFLPRTSVNKWLSHTVRPS
jgi:hypothetical protein